MNVVRLKRLLRDSTGPEKRPVVTVAVSVVVAACYFAWMAILKFDTYHAFAYDLGIYMQSLWTTINGHGFLYTSLWEGSRFAFHFEPVLLFVLPLYALRPAASTLLVLQSIAVASAAVPLYLISRRYCGPWCAVLVSVSYLLNPGLHGVASFDFHASALAIPLLLWCIYLLVVGRHRMAFVVSLAALLCRENVALILVFVGLVFWFESRRRERVCQRVVGRTSVFSWPLVISVVAVGWLLVALYLVVPHFNMDGTYPGFARYGGSPLVIFASLHSRLLYVVMLLLPVLFLPVLDPLGLLVAAPAFAQNLFSLKQAMYSVSFHHAALILPGLYFATARALEPLASSAPPVRVRLLLLVVVGSIVSALLFSPLPLRPWHVQKGEHHLVLDKAVAMIPDASSVYTQNDLFPHVCHRAEAYASLTPREVDFFNYRLEVTGGLLPLKRPWKHDGSYDYVLVDTASQQSLLSRATGDAAARLDAEYGILAEGDGVILFRRGYQGDSVCLTP